MPDLTDAISAPAGVIGRYFSVLSVIPSTLLVTYVYALGASGAWSGHPQWSKVTSAISSLGLGGTVGLGLAALLTGLLMQPLQFASVQLLEGYWGTGTLAKTLMTWRISVHRSRRETLQGLTGNATKKLSEVGEEYSDNPRIAVALENLHLLVTLEESRRLALNYPRRTNDVRPTRLGNALRRHESSAGEAYGLSAVRVVPALALVAPSQDLEYLDDSRTTMDLAVRLCVVCALATIISVAMLWRAGPAMFISGVPYALMYLFYRGAVVLAGAYGTALSTLIDLNRFALYERLHVPLPLTTALERDQNKTVMNLLRADDRASLRYKHSPS